jgi:hypothetical protein
MPFKSKAQRRKFAQLLVEGKISDETYEEWNRETGGRALPERVEKAAAKRPSGKRASARKKAVPARKTKKTGRKKSPARTATAPRSRALSRAR